MACFVVFLDVDGVLNTDTPLPQKPPIHTNLLKNLVFLHRKYGFTLVLSSTWRSFEKTRRMITSILSKQGIPIFDLTPEFPNAKEKWQQNRAKEILQWVNLNKPCAWVAIDDLPLRLPSKNFVKTNPSLGFNFAKLKEFEQKYQVLM